MKIYLDTCSIHRPLDSRTQIRIALEAEAILGVLAYCESGQLELFSSEALEFEAEQNSNDIRKEYALQVLAKAGERITLNKQMEDRARVFVSLGIMPLDALHLACAEIAQADFFCTCDDKFLKKAKSIVDLGILVVSPIELIEAIENDG